MPCVVDKVGPTMYCITKQCKGHHGYDLTSFSTMYELEGGGYVKEYLTNAELLAKLNPKSYKMPYIYDNFGARPSSSRAKAKSRPLDAVARVQIGTTARIFTGTIFSRAPPRPLPRVMRSTRNRAVARVTTMPPCPRADPAATVV